MTKLTTLATLLATLFTAHVHAAEWTELSTAKHMYRLRLSDEGRAKFTLNCNNEGYIWYEYNDNQGNTFDTEYYRDPEDKAGDISIDGGPRFEVGSNRSPAGTQQIQKLLTALQTAHTLTVRGWDTYATTFILPAHRPDPILPKKCFTGWEYDPYAY